MSTRMDNAANEVIRAAEECRFRETVYMCPRCQGNLEAYYCENRTYAVRCAHCKTITLVVADSPARAASMAGLSTQPRDINAAWIRRTQCDFLQFERLVRAMKHCIGMDYKTPYRRAGRLYYRPYRNHYSTGTNCDGVDIGLALEGLEMAKRISPDSWTFYITRKGLDWLGEQIDVTIYDEEQ